jgi:uncharacterized protein YbbK (DUF523 family)
MPKYVLVSSCLIGKKCSYDGRDRLNRDVKEFCDRHASIDICPEIAAGLPSPRERHEITGGNGRDVLEKGARVMSISGVDRTDHFLSGAHISLEKAKQNNVTVAIMKSRSPSCGKHEVHSGKFDGTMCEGPGVTTALFQLNGIKVYTEKEIEEAGKECYN